MEHPKRSIIKALTWRAFGFMATMVIVLIYSGNLKESLVVSSGVEAIKMVLYYLHERFWNKVKFGREQVPPPEYSI